MMQHRQRIQRANQLRWNELENKTNKAFLKAIGYAVLGAVVIFLIFQVATHPFDNNVKRGLEIIGVLFLLSCAAGYLLYRIKRLRN